MNKQLSMHLKVANSTVAWNRVTDERVDLSNVAVFVLNRAKGDESARVSTFLSWPC